MCPAVRSKASSAFDFACVLPFAGMKWALDSGADAKGNENRSVLYRRASSRHKLGSIRTLLDLHPLTIHGITSNHFFDSYIRRNDVC